MQITSIFGKLRQLGLSTELRHINNFGECWLCSTKDSLEDHHIIPRCNGGENGPQVTLCGVCHAAIHKMAMHQYVKSPEKDLQLVLPKLIETYQSNWNVTQALRAYFLSCSIHYTSKLVKNDSNKSARFSTKWTGKQRAMIRKLKTATGLKSQEEIIQLALNNLYARYFK